MIQVSPALWKCPLWAQLKPYLWIQTFGTVSLAIKLRPKIEFRGLPLELARASLLYETGCVHCGRILRPFRARKSSFSIRPGAWIHPGVVYAPACLGKGRRECRGEAASREFDLVLAREKES